MQDEQLGPAASPDSATATELPPTADEAEVPPHLQPGAAIPPAEVAQEPAPSSLKAIEAELQQASADEVATETASAQRPTAWDGQLPEALQRILEARLDIWTQLLRLDDARQKLRPLAAIREVRDELARQSRELQRIPPADRLEQSIGELTARREKPLQASQPAERSAPGEPSPDAVFRRLLDMGIAQAKLLLMRERLSGAIPGAGLTLAGNEPLLGVCRRSGTDGDALFGWTFYALGVLQQLDACREAEQNHRDRVHEVRAENASGGALMSLLRSACGDRQELPTLDPQITERREAAEHEMRAVEAHLTELFWSVYADLAWLLAARRLQEADQPLVRAMLRYGLVAQHPGLIAPEACAFILRDCAEDVYTWRNRTEALHVVYADEYITAIHDRNLTVSPDEELELNQRGSDEWKADRAWRQAVIARELSELYQARYEDIRRTAEDMVIEREVLEKDYATRRSRRDAQAAAVGAKLAGLRATLGRLKQALERFEAKTLPETKIKAEDAAEKLLKAIDSLTPEMVVRRETRFIRRLARLTARLKEPFPQLVLRDWFAPGRANHFSRGKVAAEIHRLEEGDPRIFHQTLVPHRKLARRVTVRLSPTFLIVPGRGQLGLSLCPRQWDDCGRMILPMLHQRQDGPESLLVDMFADFRWDCSKEEAGMDWITADALCAAYAAVRWNHRRLSDEAQKALGIDRRQKDKQNWRVHYRLFLTSAQQRGRYLFNRCHDVYKDVMLRYIGLPEGVEPLRRD